MLDAGATKFYKLFLQQKLDQCSHKTYSFFRSCIPYLPQKWDGSQYILGFIAIIAVVVGNVTNRSVKEEEGKGISSAKARK